MGGHSNHHSKDQASWTITDLVSTLARVIITGAMGTGSMGGGDPHTHNTHHPDTQRTSGTDPDLLTGAVAHSIKKGQLPRVSCSALILHFSVFEEPAVRTEVVMVGKILEPDLNRQIIIQVTNVISLE